MKYVISTIFQMLQLRMIRFFLTPSFCLILCLSIVPKSFAQLPDTLRGRNVYRPADHATDDTIQPVNDSILAREQFVRDSIFKREQFVRDSILAREQFVRDSLIRRQRIVDSLQFLQKELQYLLEAYSKSIKEDIIIRCEPLSIIGDTALGTFTCHTLPFGVREPYCPWKTHLYLTEKSIRILIDEKSHKIQSIHTPQLKVSFSYASGGIVVVHQPAVIQKNNRGHFYKNPVDSVFFDKNKKITQIKSYVLFYAVTNDNQRGNLLFTNRTLVKRYDYDMNNEIRQYLMIRYCERWKVYESNKVCSILTYDFTRQGTTYLLKRNNDPANKYSDGTYAFRFDDKENLLGISFTSLANTGNWERTIETNKEGYVSCYFDKSENRIIQSLCMIYHDEPGARFPVETITTTFEKDGISYSQVNNSTGKARTRDRMTLEWSPWR